MILNIRDKLLRWSDELEQRAKSLQQIADAHASEGRAIRSKLLYRLQGSLQARSGLVNVQRARLYVARCRRLVCKLLKESQAKRKRAAFGITL